MLTVIFNKDLANELSYEFTTYSETYSANRKDPDEPLWILRFERNGADLSGISGNLADYLSDLFSETYNIITIDVYNDNHQLIDHFDDYPFIHECVTSYEERLQLQRSELRLVRELTERG